MLQFYHYLLMQVALSMNSELTVLQSLGMNNKYTFLHNTQKKITSSVSSTIKSLTNVKIVTQTIELNAEILPSYNPKMIKKASITPESLKGKLIELLLEAKSPATLRLHSNISKWIDGIWKDIRMRINNRIGKLNYFDPYQMDSFSKIEKQILVEWKKNTLLQGFQLLWNDIFRTYKFETVFEMQQFYNTLRQIITQISFMLFQSCLQQLSKNGFQIQHRLINFTAVEIITSSKEWKNIAQDVIKPKYYSDSVSFSENYDISNLKVAPEMIDPDRNQPLFNNTAKAIEKLFESYTLTQIVQSLFEYRKSLIQQIQTNVTTWQKKHNIIKHFVSEKDDMISTNIYILVKHKLDDIGLTLKYLSFVLGNDMEKVLSAYKVDLFRVDLEACYEFITTPVVQLPIQNAGSFENNVELIST